MALILFEDEHLLVINKPAGWNTHAPEPLAGEGVYDWLKHREPRWSRLAIIHRLDKETSGVMVFGITPLANRSLTAQFANRTVRKKYLLLTDRPVPRERFTVTSALVRVGERYVSRPLHPGGDRAETKFHVITSSNGGWTVEAEPITGRTHQIRVHAAEQGMPILGDVMYDGTPAERIYLHAAELEMDHPSTGQRLRFAAPSNWEGKGDAAPDPLRAAVTEAPLTNAFRIVHGESDGLPGLYVDKLGDFLLGQSEHPLDGPVLDELKSLAGLHGSLGVYHKLLNRNVRQSKAEAASPQFVWGRPAPARFVVHENGLRFELSFEEGYSVGLFLDQRDNRRRLITGFIAADFPCFAPASGAEVLNTFAYTCGFSVAAAYAGARATSLDLSKKYLEWGKRNFSLNALDVAQHDFIYGDAFDWMRRLAKKGRAFDCVLLDPPTFSQSKESGVWQAEKSFGKLIEAALPLLKSNGILFASTNAAKLEPENFVGLGRATILSAGLKILQQHYVPQPPDFPISRGEPAYLKTIWWRVG